MNAPRMPPLPHRQLAASAFADAQKHPHGGIFLTSLANAGALLKAAEIALAVDADDPGVIALAITMADELAADGPTHEARLEWSDVARHLRNVQGEEIKERRERARRAI
jgi:hypothetical protein